MANEPTTTISGNLTADPELRYTNAGRAVASFTIASTPRFLNRDTGQWDDGETWFVRCSAWADLGTNIAETLTKGSAVLATGRLRSRSWEAEDGTKRYAVEMTVDDLGPSLRRATAKIVKTTREQPGGNGNGGAPADSPWSTNPNPAPAPVSTSGGFSEEPPF